MNNVTTTNTMHEMYKDVIKQIKQISGKELKERFHQLHRINTTNPEEALDELGKKSQGKFPKVLDKLRQSNVPGTMIIRVILETVLKVFSHGNQIKKKVKEIFAKFGNDEIHNEIDATNPVNEGIGDNIYEEISGATDHIEAADISTQQPPKLPPRNDVKITSSAAGNIVYAEIDLQQQRGNGVKITSSAADKIIYAEIRNASAAERNADDSIIYSEVNDAHHIYDRIKCATQQPPKLPPRNHSAGVELRVKGCTAESPFGDVQWGPVVMEENGIDGGYFSDTEQPPELPQKTKRLSSNEKDDALKTPPVKVVDGKGIDNTRSSELVKSTLSTGKPPVPPKPTDLSLLAKKLQESFSSEMNSVPTKIEKPPVPPKPDFSKNGVRGVPSNKMLLVTVEPSNAQGRGI